MRRSKPMIHRRHSKENRLVRIKLTFQSAPKSRARWRISWESTLAKEAADKHKVQINT